MRWLSIYISLLAFISLAGLTAGGCASGPICETDADCKVGFVCRMDPYRSIKDCLSPQDLCSPACPVGQQCLNEKCVTVCNPPCKEGEACQKGSCIDVNRGCFPSCLTTQQCVNNECVPLGEGSSTPDAQDAGTQDQTGTGESTEYPSDGGSADQPTHPENTSSEGTTENTADSPMPETSADKPSSEGTTPDTPTTESTPDKATPDKVTPDKVIPEQTPQDKGPFKCQGDKDCKTGERCIEQTCVPGPVTCKTACKGNEQCVAGKCVAEPNAGIGKPCSAKKLCAKGLECFKLNSTTSVCFQPCKYSNGCAKNTLRKACYTIGGNKSYCVQEATAGQKCGLSSSIQALCTKKTVCQDGKCQLRSEVKTLSRCGEGGKICPKDHYCLRTGTTSSGAPIRYCMRKCTIGSKTCGTTAGCEKLSGNFGYCYPYGKASADAICGSQQGAAFDLSRVCQKGLSCVYLSRPICLKIADGDCKTSKLSCPTGRTCQVIQGGSKNYSICSALCKAGKCAQSHMTCNTGLKTCWPKKP